MTKYISLAMLEKFPPNFVYQQDCGYHRFVEILTEFMNGIFLGCIRRGGSSAWPPRSPAGTTLEQRYPNTYLLFLIGIPFPTAHPSCRRKANVKVAVHEIQKPQVMLIRNSIHQHVSSPRLFKQMRKAFHTALVGGCQGEQLLEKLTVATGHISFLARLLIVRKGVLKLDTFERLNKGIAG
ncbi:hypothetical protein CDAR_469061 [Caerostris darwini]|uniref:Uncharacterized protein n=1 Tax=Caerostris darwini TaxID=1538125 RepID=A0AAV4VGX2_9ARAC|nr:hypothetical protein CDAR_469061 [Caerostris darwini]